MLHAPHAEAAAHAEATTPPSPEVAPSSVTAKSLRDTLFVMAKDCTTIVFKRKKKGGKTLPKSQWKRVRRCKGRKLRYHGGKRCHAGGSDWKQKVRANFRKGLRGKRALAPAKFVACD